MRRALAVSLAMLFSFLLIAPGFAAAAGSRLPSCCLRTGKHHCAMRNAARGHSNSPSLLPSSCASFPHSIFGVEQQAAGTIPQAAISADMAHRATLAAQTLAGYRVAPDRSLQKRGPPILILS